MNTRDARLAALWGYSAFLSCFVRLASQLRRTIRGHWDVLDYGDVRLVCRCGRSEPITILPEDSARVFFLSMASTLVRSVGKSCTSLPTNLNGSSLGSICTGRPSIPKPAWSFQRTGAYTKDLRTRTTNAPEGSSTHNSGENRLKQSTVCAPSAVIQSVSTHTTYA